MSDTMNHAAAVTYSGTAGAVIFSAAHVSELAVALSAMASVGGFLLQFYLAFKRIRSLEVEQRAQTVSVGKEMERQDASATRAKVRIGEGEVKQVAADEKSASNTTRIENIEKQGTSASTTENL